MLLSCSRVKALFPREKIFLEHAGQAQMLVDEHGGTLILKVGDLQFRDIAAPGEESGLFLEVEPAPTQTLAHNIEVFAAAQSLTLPPVAAPAPACQARPILAACHLPGRNKFIFAEDSRMEARSANTGVVEIAVLGEFKARTVPCQEADLVIHLAPADLARLLSHLLAWSREAR